MQISIDQRSRDNKIVKSYGPVTAPGVTAGIGLGLAWDGAYLWVCAKESTDFLKDGQLYQLDLPSCAIVRTTATYTGLQGISQIVDIVHNGLNFWALHEDVSIANDDRITQIDGVGSVLGPSGLVGFVYGNGIAFDGSLISVIDADPFGFAASNIRLFDPATLSMVKQIGTVVLGAGLVFDGEFFVTHEPVNSPTATFDFMFLDRAGNLIKTHTGETKQAGQQEGFTFDGEFFYTLRST